MLEVNYTDWLASSGSKRVGICNTGRSLVEMPRCCRDMCECSELRDLATVPHNTHLCQITGKSLKWKEDIS